MSADRWWYVLGRFRIFARPLEQNAYWTTYHIYLGGLCIGRQISVPCETDCEWHERVGRFQPSRTATFMDVYYTEHRRPGPGRPRKDRPLERRYPWAQA